jgi:hypothetical protein
VTGWTARKTVLIVCCAGGASLTGPTKARFVGPVSVAPPGFFVRSPFLFLYVIANLFYSLIIGSLSGTLHSSKHYTRELGDE